MPMTHSAYSRAPAYAVHQLREMGRCHGKWREGGWYLQTAKARAVTPVNSIRPRYTTSRWPTFRIWRSLQSGGMKWGERTSWTDRGDWRQRAWKGRNGRLGRPYKVSGSEAAEGQASCGNHNHGVPCGESAWPIVALKPGNAGGAKGLYFRSVFIEERRAA